MEVIKKLKSDIDVELIYEELCHDWVGRPRLRPSAECGYGKENSTNDVFRESDIMPITNVISDQIAREKEGRDSTVWLYHYPELQKFFTWFTDTYEGTVKMAALFSTPPGKGTTRHADTSPYWYDKDRFHLILAGKYKYTVHGETQIFSKGDLWWFNNKLEHESYNHINEDKIHIVFDVAGLRQ